MSMKMTAVLFKAGTPLSDGNTIIDSSLMKQMVNDFNEHFQNEQINHYHYGTINGESFSNVDFDDITHKINNVYIKDKHIMSDINILDNPKGKIIQEIMQQCYGKNRKNIHASLDLIKHDGKIDIHSVSLNLNNENYRNRKM